ncbi:MAG TPA: PilZ domain-containing protein, partial [Gemmataceae bacterium]|nr:PilZ domain-containing protein [Gemmataceae bacterium]
RYYYSAPVSERVRQEQSQQQNVRRAVDELLRRHPAGDVAPFERRGQDRVDFVQSVAVRAENGEEFTLLSRDLSTTGVRLVGTRRLLGQKVHVLFPAPDGEASCDFVVRILWTCAVGDGLFENGGVFLDVNHQGRA